MNMVLVLTLSIKRLLLIRIRNHDPDFRFHDQKKIEKINKSQDVAFCAARSSFFLSPNLLYSTPTFYLWSSLVLALSLSFASVSVLLCLRSNIFKSAKKKIILIEPKLLFSMSWTIFFVDNISLFNCQCKQHCFGKVYRQKKDMYFVCVRVCGTRLVRSICSMNIDEMKPS